MWLHGQPIDLAASYSVTVNSFLASGGDNFRELASGAGKRDTGKVDLAAMVDYMEAAAATGAVPVDYSQRAVEVTFDEGAPTEYASGSTVEFDVKSWSMSTPVDVKDSELVVTLGDQELGPSPSRRRSGPIRTTTSAPLVCRCSCRPDCRPGRRR